MPVPREANFTVSNRAVFNPSKASKIHVLRQPTQSDASYSMMPVLQDSQLFEQKRNLAKKQLQYAEQNNSSLVRSPVSS